MILDQVEFWKFLGEEHIILVGKTLPNAPLWETGVVSA